MAEGGRRCGPGICTGLSHVHVLSVLVLLLIVFFRALSAIIPPETYATPACDLTRLTLTLHQTRLDRTRPCIRLITCPVPHQANFATSLHLAAHAGYLPRAAPGSHVEAMPNTFRYVVLTGLLHCAGMAPKRKKGAFFVDPRDEDEEPHEAQARQMMAKQAVQKQTTLGFGKSPEPPVEEDEDDDDDDDELSMSFLTTTTDTKDKSRSKFSEIHASKPAKSGGSSSRAKARQRASTRAAVASCACEQPAPDVPPPLRARRVRPRRPRRLRRVPAASEGSIQRRRAWRHRSRLQPSGRSRLWVNWA